MSTQNTIAEMPARKYATLTIDGQEYQLAWSMKALCAAERHLGGNLLQCHFRLGAISSEELRGLLFAYLLPAQPKTTVEEVYSMIRLDTMTAILEALGEAISLSAKKSDTPESEPEKVAA